MNIAWWWCSYIIQKQKDPSKAHQIKLEVIVKALKWLEMDMDVDEVYNVSIQTSCIYFREKLLPSELLCFSQLRLITKLSNFGFYLFIFQVECIISILIFKNLVKGYFAHKSKVVVLSKQDPFPKLNGKSVNS